MSSITLRDTLQATAKANLADAHALPFAAYTDPDIYAQERDAIFHRDWVFICAEQELAKPGDYKAVTLAGEPIVIIRGKDQTLRALSNVCRHRGTVILDDGNGSATKLVCPYHAWTYDDQGALRGVPHPGKIEVDKSRHCLPEFNLTIWNSLVFVNLSGDAPPLADKLAGLEYYFKLFEADTFKNAITGDPEHWHTNWKLAMENAMESYHLFKVHPKTLEPYSPTKDAFYIEGSAPWSVTAGKTRGMAGLAGKLWGLLSSDKQAIFEHYVLISVPPSLVGVLSYGSFAWITMLPAGVDQTQVLAAGISSSSGEDKSAQEFTTAFFAEDKWICERGFQGMQSRYGQGGKLVELERIVVDFHNYLAWRLFDEPPRPRFQNDEATALFK